MVKVFQIFFLQMIKVLQTFSIKESSKSKYCNFEGAEQRSAKAWTIDLLS